MEMTLFNKLAVKAAPLTGKLVKHAPGLLLGGGILGICIGTVLACKATLKMDETLSEANDKLEEIEAFTDDNYTEEDRQKDMAITYVKTGVAIVKQYLPAAILIGGGIACIVGGHKIQKKRLLGLAAAYTAVDTGFKAYRKNVVDELGAEADQNFRYGIRETEVEEVKTLKNGNEKIVKTKAAEITGFQPSEYARYFEPVYYDDDGTQHGSTEFDINPDYNLLTLRSKEAMYNDLLRMRGHVFLNEVYHELGFEHTPAGAVVGWVYDPKNGEGNNYISFGIYDPANETARKFVNSETNCLLLDFNVDGVIWDKI